MNNLQSLFEDIKIYLPKYLSPESEKELFKNLSDFPNNINEILYSHYLIDSQIIYQGDAIKDLLVIKLPDPTVTPTTSVILSNTCDIDLSNQGFSKTSVAYSPIINLEKYESKLKRLGFHLKRVANHINAIKKQSITNTFFLPAINGTLEDSIIQFDRICSCRNDSIERVNLQNKRIFTLSNYGFYLFLFKLSLHFTRIQEKVQRN